LTVELPLVVQVIARSGDRCQNAVEGRVHPGKVAPLSGVSLNSKSGLWIKLCTGSDEAVDVVEVLVVEVLEEEALVEVEFFLRK